MRTDPTVTLSPDLRGHIEDAERAAQQTPLAAPPGCLTECLDPPVTVARSFSEYLPEHQRPDLQVTRSDLLKEGSKLTPESSADDLQAFLWLVQAWGYGTSGVGVARTKRILADPDRFTCSAREVLGMLHDEDRDSVPVEAFYHLRNQAGHVRHWGPAFFTKFLAFADPANQPGTTLTRRPALILDQWIADAVNYYLPEPYCSRRPSRKAPLGRFAQSGWNTPQYAYYLSLVERLTREERFASPPYSGRPLSVERVLFHCFRDGDGRLIGQQ